MNILSFSALLLLAITSSSDAASLRPRTAVTASNSIASRALGAEYEQSYEQMLSEIHQIYGKGNCAAFTDPFMAETTIICSKDGQSLKLIHGNDNTPSELRGCSASVEGDEMATCVTYQGPDAIFGLLANEEDPPGNRKLGSCSGSSSACAWDCWVGCT